MTSITCNTPNETNVQLQFLFCCPVRSQILKRMSQTLPNWLLMTSLTSDQWIRLTSTAPNPAPGQSAKPHWVSWPLTQGASTQKVYKRPLGQIYGNKVEHCYFSETSWICMGAPDITVTPITLLGILTDSEVLLEAYGWHRLGRCWISEHKQERRKKCKELHAKSLHLDCARGFHVLF